MVTREHQARLSAATVVMVVTFAGVATAAHVSTFLSSPTDLVDLWFGDSDFGVSSFSTSYTGKNRVNVDVTLKNFAPTSAIAEVTVRVLDASESAIKSQTKTTGQVAGGGSVTLAFVLDDPGIVDEYKKTVIDVRQD